jgi:hypothetical protein
VDQITQEMIDNSIYMGDWVYVKNNPDLQGQFILFTTYDGINISEAIRFDINRINMAIELLKDKIYELRAR